MDNFKLASRQRLKFQTTVGPLTTEQLWGLSLTELDELAVSLEIVHENSAKKSYRKKTVSEKDKTAKLKFDIVVDIINTLEEEEQAASDAKAIKKHNEKILAQIAELDENEFKGKSREELVGMLK